MQITTLGPNKAFAAGSSTTLAGAIVSVTLGIFWPDASPEIAGGLVTIIAAAIGMLATWLTPPGVNATPAVILPSPPGTTAADLNRAELRRHTEDYQP